MRYATLLTFALVSSFCMGQELSKPTWRGSVWALGAASDRETAGGGLFLRPMDQRDGQFTFDGLQFGVDVPLSQAWTLKVTLMAGRAGQLLQEFSSESGSLGFPEAMLIWSNGKDTVRLGRMWTWMGMESTDLTAAVPASHGLMATFPLPFGQVGVDWRHAFSPSWSTALWLFNGEDRIRDNNRSKTVGVGLIYNHGGAQDRFLNLMAFRGAEQDDRGPGAVPGASGRLRERLSHSGQWAWGGTTLAWEVEVLRERFPVAWVAGAAGARTGTLTGGGLTFRHPWNERWAGYLRAEAIRDDLGFRLNWDPDVQVRYGMRRGADLTARALSLGVERRWTGGAFARLEARRDDLNRDVADRDGKAFRSAHSLTLCVGAAFSR